MREKELPEGWEETTIPEMISNDGLFVDGDWIESKDQDVNGDVRLIQLADIGIASFRDKSFRFLTSQKAKELNCSFLEKGDILIARMPDPLGRACIFPLKGKFVTVVDVAIIRPGETSIEVKWLMHFINSPIISRRINELASGTTRQRISRRNLANIPFPLPPLAEQKRIVAKLDEAFQHLGTLKAKLARIPELLKTFRQSVLTHLTISSNSTDWKQFALGELGKWAGGGTPSKSVKEYWATNEVLWITPKDMKALFLNDSIDKISNEAVKSSATKLIEANSILFVTRSGILRRIFPISLNTTPTTVNQDLKALTLKNEFDPKFILYLLVGHESELRDKCMKSGTTVESIEFDFLKKFQVEIPSLEEQKEIVKKIEALFAAADALEVHYQKLKQKIDQLPQALLAKAFRGELVPQDPTDEPASVLLEKIKAAKASTAKAPKSKKPSKRADRNAAVIPSHFCFSFLSLLSS